MVAITDLGGSYISVVENKKTTIQISDDIVPYLQEAGIQVNDDPTYSGWGIFKKTEHHYSYECNEYVKEVVSVRKLDNSIDSLIYMVKQLEAYAIEFCKENNNTNINNLVLGYLRCINSSYCNFDYIEKSGLTNTMFSYICDSYSQDFVDYVNQNEYNKFPSTNSNITIGSYFASFISSNLINDNYYYYDEYGLKQTIQPKSTSKTSIIEPISNQIIDIIHMFCVIDGCDVSKDAILEDLISWAGDLQQGIAYISINNNLSVSSFNDVMNKSIYCSKADILADIDGYNIGINLLNSLDNKLSESIAAYYKAYNNKLRFKAFIISVARTNNKDGIVVFNDCITKACLVKANYTTDRVSTCFNIIINKNPANNQAITTPNLSLRKKIAYYFVDYICDNAGYNNWEDLCGGKISITSNVFIY